MRHGRLKSRNAEVVRWFAVWNLALVLFSHSCMPVAIADDLVNRFEIEHVAAWKRIEDAYSKIELTEEIEQPSRIRDGKKPITHSYMANGTRSRMDTDTPEIGMRVSVATESICFRLERPVAQSEFLVKDINHHDFREIREGMMQRGCLPFAPYSVMDLRLIDLVALPKFERSGYEVVTVDGEQLLRMKWRDQYTDDKGKPQIRVGWFLFLPGSWAVREFEFRYFEDAFGAVRARIEYDGLHEGIPLIKSIRQWADRRDGTTEPRMTSRVIRLSTSPPTDEVFTLAAFNLPNDLGEAGKPRGGRLLMILVGLIGLAASWFLTAWIRRRNASNS